MTDGYTLNKSLVNSLILSCLTAIVVIGGYMVTWNSSDKAWKKGMDIRMDTVVDSVRKIENRVDEQILPQAKWRLDKIEDWAKGHENDHRSKQ